MGFYQRHIVPHLIHLSMSNRQATRWRARVVPAARGRVLEIGAGSGLNLPFYGPEVRAVTALEPSEALLAKAAKRARHAAFDIELVHGVAEDLRFEDRAFDSVVMTWTLCSIGDPATALAQMRRVLNPDGELIFIEHGLSPDSGVAAWQRRLNPLWNRCSGGCNLNRPIGDLIRAAGFVLNGLETGYLIKGPRPLTYHYRGRARPA
ncbi:MAG: class I SAM-dependent methyltransferase [Kiloniellaceae bacterium]